MAEFNNQEQGQLSRGMSVLVVILICLFVSLGVSFVGYFFLWPEVEKRFFMAEVPDVQNMMVSEASQALRTAGLVPSVAKEQESDSIEPGRIISQVPLARTTAKRGSEVALVISKKPSFISVPLVKGLIVDEARKKILDAGLVIGDIQEVDDKSPKGTVVRVNPPEMAKVKKGTVIELDVSKGEKPKIEVVKVQVPKLIGMKLAAAQNALAKAGLKLGKVKRVSDEENEFDQVLQQSPPAGTMVPQGSAVSVTYNGEEEDEME